MNLKCKTYFILIRSSLVMLFVCMILSTIAAENSHAKLKGLVGAWFFNEAKGDVAEDFSGNGNDGKVMNDPKWVQGKFDKALELDGKDDYVDAGDAEMLKPTADVTFVAWTYWIGGNYVLASGGQTSSTGYAITNNPDTSQIWFGVSTGKKSANTGYIKAPSKKAWHHLAGSYDDSEGKLIAYVDGKEYATVKAADKVLENKFASLHIGLTM